MNIKEVRELIANQEPFKNVREAIREFEELALGLGVDKEALWNAHAETWHECWDCGVTLTDSKIHTDPTCPSCGKVWTMS